MSIAACAEIVQRADPDRFMAAMASPPEARKTLFPLYAFNVEVSRAPWVTQEPMIAEMRLQFWRDVLEEIASGKPPRAHEVAVPLAEVLSPEGAKRLDALVAARRWDIYKDPFEDRAHFDDYLSNTSGLLVEAAGRALGAPADASEALTQAGWAFGLAGFFRAIPALESAGRVPLIECTPQAVRDLAEEGLARLAQARSMRGQVPAPARPALFVGWRAEAALRAARDVPERVIEGKLDESEFARRARLLWVSATGRW